MSYPFGSGPPHQPGYPPQGGGYPPHQQAADPGYPHQHGGAPGYPPSFQGGMPAYPPHQGAAPGYPTHQGYPPTGAPGYPPSQYGAPGYPPQHGGGTPGYPPVNQGAYPGYPPQTPAYPPQPNYPGGPSHHAPYPSMPQANYPNVPSQQQPYPPAVGVPSPYPGAGHQPESMAGMANCFKEMSQHVTQINSETSRTKLAPTVTPANPFSPADDAKALRKAMKGFGTDEDTLIQILCHRTNDQIQLIKRDFKTSFGKDLVEDIKSETSGWFEHTLVALLTPRVEFYVQELQRAIDGVGTDEDALIEILCSLTNNEIQTIKNEYQRVYFQSLESQLESETSGHFRRLLVSLCSANRDESGHVDCERARQDAIDLKTAGIDQAGTDESAFNAVICQRNYAQLRLICEEYESLTGSTLLKTIESEFSGDIKDGLKAVVRCVSNRPEFFAKCLYKSMVGFGTRDAQLIRLLVTRCEIDLADIKVAFQKKYGKTLRSFIQGDTSGHYKHALYHLIGETAS